jgi:hypothetical protein
MRQRIGVALAAALAALAGSRVASAQLVVGVPVYVAPSGTGVLASADYGHAQGGGKTYALTGGIAFSRLGAEVSVGSTEFNVLNNKVAFGGLVGAQLFGGGLNPVAIGVEAGYSQVSESGVTARSIPIGATVRLSPPLFPLKPFGVVYYQASDDIKREVRFSVGADFNLLLGLGVHAAYDWGNEYWMWGVGAHLKFSLPGM